MEELKKLGNIPPHSIEAEQSVLGAMILDKDAIIAALEILRAEDFYKEANGEIFESVLELYNRNEPVD
ncbi:MAG: DnaB-like helicase N-terminal domain-containing protein, partial [Senegalia sp. (in: firmicutes)]